MYTATFQKIDEIGGMHYRREVLSETLVIYGIGAPLPPDNGTLPDASIIMKFDTDIFVPDYIGYGRSDGVFTPKNCIRTFTKLFDLFSTGCLASNSYKLTEEELRYKRIIFIGRSLGGTYIPLLPRFDKRIAELAIFCPVVDSKSCGSIKGEESNVDFLRSMKNDGYYHLYRGILDPIWRNHLENEDDLSPMDNIEYLTNAKLFIGHGKKDTCVNFSKSAKYYNQLLKLHPQKKKQFKFSLYPQGDHGSSTTNMASWDFLMWLNIPEL